MTTQPQPPSPALVRALALVERYPDRSPPRFSLGRALHDAGRIAEAEGHYAEAARLQPDLMMAWLHHAECLVELGRPAEARVCATEALRLARVQGHTGPQAEAEDLLDAVADLISD